MQGLTLGLPQGLFVAQFRDLEDVSLRLYDLEGRYRPFRPTRIMNHQPPPYPSTRTSGAPLWENLCRLTVSEWLHERLVLRRMRHPILRFKSGKVKLTRKRNACVASRRVIHSNFRSSKIVPAQWWSYGMLPCQDKKKKRAKAGATAEKRKSKIQSHPQILPPWG